MQSTIQAVRVPNPNAFWLDALGKEQADYLPAPQLAALAQELIDRHPSLHHIEGFKVVYLWKRKGGEKNGKATLGTCQKLSGLAKFLSGGAQVDETADFVISLSADHLALMSEESITPALHHEMLHVGHDDDGKPVLWAHDVEMFTDEVNIYGLWKSDLKEAADALKQARLGF